MTHILLVEDNPIDARLMQRFLSGKVTWVDDGQKALYYLRCLESGGMAEPPSLVLLDLNLPRYDGLQVLAEFRKSAAGCELPIFLLSSTPPSEVAELAQRKNLWADDYIQKPYGLTDLEQFGRRIALTLELNFSAARTAAA